MGGGHSDMAVTRVEIYDKIMTVEMLMKARQPEIYVTTMTVEIYDNGVNDSTLWQSYANLGHMTES